MKSGCASGEHTGVTQPLPGSGVRGAAPSRSQMEVSRAPSHVRGTSVRLREADACALRSQCARAGMSAPRYVSTLLATVEEGRTQIAGKDAVEALAQSNYQLSWLGRNLQELLRRLQATSPQLGDEADILSVQEATGLLKAHLLRASAVLSDIEATRCTRRKTASRANGSPRTKG